MGLKEKIIIGVVGLLVVLIPVTSYVISYRFRSQTKAQAELNRKSGKLDLSGGPKEVPKTAPIDELKKNLGIKDATKSAQKGSSEVFFGPTLNFKLKIGGRPEGKQATDLFLGVAEGNPTNNPTYLLSFNVDVPDSGEYKGLSLAGLTQGSKYTAYLKARAQIATTSAFLLKPSVTDIGVLNLLTGDLNEDNIINSADYSIIKGAFGTNSKSKNWNQIADFNLDGVINNFDLIIVIKNFNKTGQSGPYFSTTPTASSSGIPAATSSGSLFRESSRGGVLERIPGVGGYWLWVPEEIDKMTDYLLPN